ncbi:MAG: lytic transglycosylase domain-containing protein [Ferruginibacter sp.]|nr:lytic transglycosylase domain-containing protein [Ferruginibacter sp.]
MIVKPTPVRILLIFFYVFLSHQSGGQVHDILFCGEKIPVSSGFVAGKLMRVIKKQMRFINMSNIRSDSKKYFPLIEDYLMRTNLPQDFKYLAIVESAFNNAVSKAGAAGFWQLMPNTAREKGLMVNELVDERNNINKATYAACKVLADYYKLIYNKYGIYSWVLATAAYNFGIGNITKVISRQGTNYFEMKLNDETAAYVYKIIAIKELFEYPELYMKDFGYNVFAGKSPASPATIEDLNETDTDAFNSIIVNASNEKDSSHPADINLSDTALTTAIIPVNEESVTSRYIAASIRGKYKDFHDGDLVTIELRESLQVRNRFVRKGNTIKGPGWIIDDKVFIDLNFGRSVALCDGSSSKGVSLSALKDGVPVLLKVTNIND